MSENPIKISFGAGLKRDLDAEYQGKWFMLSDGTEVKLRSVNYKPFQSAQTALQKRLKGKDIPSDAKAMQAIELAAQHLITDWKAEGEYEVVKDGKKIIERKPIPFDRKLIVDMAKDEAYATLFAEIIMLAQNEADFRAEELEDDLKN